MGGGCRARRTLRVGATMSLNSSAIRAGHGNSRIPQPGVWAAEMRRVGVRQRQSVGERGKPSTKCTLCRTNALHQRAGHGMNATSCLSIHCVSFCPLRLMTEEWTVVGAGVCLGPRCVADERAAFC